MSDGWRERKVSFAPIGFAGLWRVVFRGFGMAVVTFGGLALLLLVRLIEWPLFGADRPITPRITQMVCRSAFRIMGIRLQVRGAPMLERGAVVANHASWLDILALNAALRVYFVAKSEVSAWPGIGWLARATGTLFIARKATDAKRQQNLFLARLKAGHRLLFFPEGTSTDTLRILPFKPTLFAAFFSHGLEQLLHIQPVTVKYVAPKGADPRFYGWWGDMNFAPHFVQVLAARRHGMVEVILHSPVAVDRFADRKALSAACETTIRASGPRDRQAD